MRFHMLALLRDSRLLSDRTASVAIEYALIAGMISTVIVAGLLTIHGELNLIFNSVSNGLVDN